MKHKTGILNQNIYFGVCGIVATLAFIPNSFAANVVQRDTVTTANRISVTRPTMAASRMPTMTVNTSAASSTTTTTTTTTTPAETTNTTTSEQPKSETPSPVVENKSSQFGAGLTSKSDTQIDTAATSLAELVRAQRAALDAADAAAITAVVPNAAGNGENSCDTALRECMIGKCGTGFAKCVADTDTAFFDKMDTCRRTTNCTGREYQLFSVEIKADRDLNAQLANYNATIDCGNNYDACIVAQCGANYSKCIGKSAGDTAIAKCESIAKSCIERDSGLAMRAMGVFGELRSGAERQIAVDEQRLYALRDQMRALCTRLGAMFDERSLDCVYTVNFYAGDNTLFASKKLYAGSTFDCTQNWFGIDVTTFRENAFRETRAQTSASSAMLGSGVGQAVGALTSGAIDRAIDRHRADKALDDAIKECKETYGENAPECQKQISERAALSDQGDVGDKLGDATNALSDIKSKVESAQQQAGDGVIDGAAVSPVATPESSAPTPTEQPAADDEGVVMSKAESTPDKCNEKKDWYSLKDETFNERYKSFSRGIHNLATNQEYSDDLNKISDLCFKHGGKFNRYTETLDWQSVRAPKDTDLRNICGTYNKYQRYICEFDDPDPNGTRCKKIFYPNNDAKVEGVTHTIYADQADTSREIQARRRNSDYFPNAYSACEFKTN